MAQNPNTLGSIVWSIANVSDLEIGCDGCFDQMDRFVDLVVAGDNAAEVLPAVKTHLDHCPFCREEYVALLTAVRGPR